MHYVTKKTLNVCVPATPNVVIYIPPGEHVTTDGSSNTERVALRWRGRAYVAAETELRLSADPELEPVN